MNNLLAKHLSSVTSFKTKFFLFAFLILGFYTGNAQVEKPNLSIGVIADPQYADKDSRGTRFYRNSLVKLGEAVNYLNQQDISFSVVLGDLVDLGTKDLPPILLRLDSLKKPVYNLLGNHDYEAATDKYGLFKQFNMPKSYYSVKQGDWTFILLNTNELSEYATTSSTPLHSEYITLRDRLKLAQRKNAQPWNGGISSNQMAWMEGEIQQALAESKKVIIFSHHPLFPENGLEALNNREILEALEKYTNVRAVISGHHHEGNFALYNKLPIVTLEGMVETASENAFGKMDLFHNRIEINGQGRMTSRVFYFNN